jgi:hypothetical protein
MEIKFSSFQAFPCPTTKKKIFNKMIQLIYILTLVLSTLTSPALTLTLTNSNVARVVDLTSYTVRETTTVIVGSDESRVDEYLFAVPLPWATLGSTTSTKPRLASIAAHERSSPNDALRVTPAMKDKKK